MGHHSHLQRIHPPRFPLLRAARSADPNHLLLLSQNTTPVSMTCRDGRRYYDSPPRDIIWDHLYNSGGITDASLHGLIEFSTYPLPHVAWIS